MRRDQLLACGLAGLLGVAATAAAAEEGPPPGAKTYQEERDDFSVRVAVPDPQQSEAIFGLPLDSRGIQPVWVEIENRGDREFFFAPISTDPDYYSPLEVSWHFHDPLRPQADAARDAMFFGSRIPMTVPPHGRAAGYVFTHRETGLKFVTITLAREGQEEDFRFIVPVAGPKLAVERVDFERIYPQSALREVDLDGLHAALAALPCCGAGQDGTGRADPLNLVLIGDGLSVIFPLVERGWRFVQPLDLRTAIRSAEDFVLDGNDPELPVSPMWVFGRREDAALEKPRDSIRRRNHLRLWLTPLRYHGQSVFVGQISRDVGIEHTDKVWYLTTHKIDPDVDLDRDYLLQDLLLSGAVARFGWVEGVGVSTPADPHVNLVGDPYLTDGRRLVVFLGADRPRFLPLNRVDWGR